MNKSKIILIIIFITVIFYFPIQATYSYFITHYIFNNSNNQKIDWIKLYPFPQKKNEIKTNLLQYIEQINKKLRSKIINSERKFNGYLPFRYKIGEFQMFFEKIINKRIFFEYIGLMLLKDDYLYSYTKNYSTNYSVKNTLNLYKFIRDLKMDFIFVIYPNKISNFNNQLPFILKDNENLACDEFISSLNNNSIKNIDLREKSKMNFKNHYEIFFRIDHHWKPLAGLWAAKEICNYLNFEFSWNIETSLLETDKYQVTTIPNFFLGSQGKQITLSYVSPKISI